MWRRASSRSTSATSCRPRASAIGQYKRCPGGSEEPQPDGSNIFTPAEQAALDCTESVASDGRHQAMIRRLASFAIIIAAGFAAFVLTGARGGAGRAHDQDPVRQRVRADRGRRPARRRRSRPARPRSSASRRARSARPGASTQAGPPRTCAVVEAKITEPGFESFRADASCNIRQQSLIGEYFVDCQPGSSREELVEQHGADRPDDVDDPGRPRAERDAPPLPRALPPDPDRARHRPGRPPAGPGERAAQGASGPARDQQDARDPRGPDRDHQGLHQRLRRRRRGARGQQARGRALGRLGGEHLGASRRLGAATSRRASAGCRASSRSSSRRWSSSAT